MTKKASNSEPEPIGERIRRQRVEVLNKGLREMARNLDIAPAHLTDLEKGRRKPSEELLVKICKAYALPEAELRSGWERADTVVAEVANQNPVTAEKVPEFLRTARDLTAEQWEQLIRQASKYADQGRGKQGK